MAFSSPPPVSTPVQEISLRGGRLCLDFTNTVDPRTGVDDRDYLVTYDDLLTWAVHAGGLAEGKARDLRQEAVRRPAAAQATLEAAVKLREAIYRIFMAISGGTVPNATDLEALNAALARSMAHARVVRRGGAFGWEWDPEPGALDRVLWPIARDAAELLTSEDVARVRGCAGDTCGWLFLDVSKNRSRRWCNMESCGNRAKARRHYARRRRADRRAS